MCIVSELRSAAEAPAIFQAPTAIGRDDVVNGPVDAAKFNDGLVRCRAMSDTRENIKSIQDS